MSLATRCTACGTVFRVVQDQLKVSEGWVRCGRCNEVFNALEGLFDLERDAPPGGSAPAMREPLAAVADGEHDVSVEVEQAMPGAEPEPLIEASGAPQAMSSHDTGQHSTPAGRISERDRLDFPDAQFDPEMLSEDAVLQQVPAIELESEFVGNRKTGVGEPADAPEFVRHGRRRELWQSPLMRALQVSVLLLLLAALGLQTAHHFRNTVAARWPGVTPILTAWCGAMACAIEAPLHIEDVAVESTSLTRASVPDAFKLAVVLRNRSAAVVAVPSVDLTLTDASGQVIARRMLAPRDFRVASTAIKPGAESALQLALVAGNARVTGYTVEVFYP